MRVRSKLITMTLFVALVPLAVSAFQSVRIHERALERTLELMHEDSVEFAATSVSDYLEYVRSSLRTMVRETIQWDELSGPEREGALWLTYGQFPSSVIAQLSVGGETEQRAFLAEVSPRYADHASIDEQEIAEFERRVPPPDESGAIGAPLRLSSGTVVIPLSFRARAPSSEVLYAFSLGLGTSRLCERLERAKPADADVALYDRSHRLVCSTRGVADLSLAPGELRAAFRASNARYERKRDGDTVRGMVASLASGWYVVTEQPLSVVEAPAEALRDRALLWLIVGAVAAIGSGLLLSQSVHQPLLKLTEGARQIGRGNLRYRVVPESDDEFAQLATTLNSMADELERRDAEIREWNAELQRRVELRGKQLEDTHEALLRSQKLAGLSTLAAGLAHEMNNPLTGILGLSQVLASQAAKGRPLVGAEELLGSVVAEAQRMATLVGKMQTLSEVHGAGDVTEVRVAPLVEGVLLALRGTMRERSIELTKKFDDEDGRILGDPYKLNQALSAIVDNALHAMSERGGKLRVETARLGSDWIQIRVADTGDGISPEQLRKIFEPFYTTQADVGAQGLGLTPAHQIIEGHGGKLDVKSRVGEGTEVQLRLPSTDLGAHLE